MTIRSRRRRKRVTRRGRKRRANKVNTPRKRKEDAAKHSGEEEDEEYEEADEEDTGKKKPKQNTATIKKRGHRGAGSRLAAMRNVDLTTHVSRQMRSMIPRSSDNVYRKIALWRFYVNYIGPYRRGGYKMKKCTSVRPRRPKRFLSRIHARQ